MSLTGRDRTSVEFSLESEFDATVTDVRSHVRLGLVFGRIWNRVAALSFKQLKCDGNQAHNHQHENYIPELWIVQFQIRTVQFQIRIVQFQIRTVQFQIQTAIPNPDCTSPSPDCTISNLDCTIPNPDCTIPNPDCTIPNPDCGVIEFSKS